MCCGVLVLSNKADFHPKPEGLGFQSVNFGKGDIQKVQAPYTYAGSGVSPLYPTYGNYPRILFAITGRPCP